MTHNRPPHLDCVRGELAAVPDAAILPAPVQRDLPPLDHPEEERQQRGDGPKAARDAPHPPAVDEAAQRAHAARRLVLVVGGVGGVVLVGVVGVVGVVLVVVGGVAVPASGAARGDVLGRGHRERVREDEHDEQVAREQEEEKVEDVLRVRLPLEVENGSHDDRVVHGEVVLVVRRLGGRPQCVTISQVEVYIYIYVYIYII